jgi:hypothetical protein
MDGAGTVRTKLMPIVDTALDTALNITIQKGFDSKND